LGDVAEEEEEEEDLLSMLHNYGGGEEEEGGGKEAVTSTKAKEKNQEAEEEEEGVGRKRRGIRWKDEEEGDIESFDVKRARMREAGREAAHKPVSAWALKLREEQLAFAKATAAAMDEDDSS